MAWQYTPYTIPLVIAGVISGALALYMWRRRHSVGAPVIALLMLGASIWSFEYALQLLSADLATQLLWGKLQYLCIVFGPVAWLYFALEYTGRDRWLRPRNLALLAVVPLLTVLAVWTNEFHGLIWKNLRLETTGTFAVKTATYGDWFWLHTAYCYLLLLIGSILIIDILIRSRDTYRKQAGALLVFAAAPWVGNALYIAGLNPFPHIDLTPFTFIITGAALAWGIFRFQLADLIPIANAAIIDGMDDAVIVLDAHDRIASVNHATRRIINAATPDNEIGKALRDVYPELADGINTPDDETPSNNELILGENGDRRVYDVRVSPLFNRKGRIVAKVAALRDITERKRMEKELEQQRETLEEKIQDRTAELTTSNQQLMQEIAERKRIQDALKRSEQQYHRILESSYDMVVVLDDEGKIIFANKAYQEDTGYTLEESNRLGLINTIHPDDRDKTRNSLRKVMAGEPERNFHCRRINKNGEVRWTETNVDPIHWPGTDYAILGVTRDITERKQVEETLRLSEERYHRILDACHDMISVVDENANLLYSNKALHEGTGYTLGEIERIDSVNTIHPDDRDKVVRWLLKVFKGEPARGVEFRGIHKNGETRWIESNADLIDWPGAEKAVLNVLRDITDRKKAEEELRLSEERYQRILDSCHDMISVVDENANLLYSNRALHEGTGYTLEDIEHMDGFDTIHPDDRENIAQWFLKILNGDVAHGIEYRGIHKSGETRWVESNANRIEWPGAEKAVLNVLRDITDRKEKDEALRLSEERYRRILDSCHDMICVLDKNAELLYSNRALRENTGYADGKGFSPGLGFENVHPDDRKRVAYGFQKVLAGEPVHGSEYRGIHKSGETRWVESNADPINWPGAEKAVVNVLRDVTERKRAAKELRLSEERYQRILDSCTENVFVFDIYEGVLYANRAWQEDTGYSLEEVKGDLSFNVIHSDDYEKVGGWVQELIEGKSVRSLEYRRINKNGDIRWVESNATPIDWPGAEKAFVNVLRDVTDRKRVADALRESEERYRTLVDSSLTGIFVNQDGKLRFVNKQFIEISGYSEEELLGMPFTELLHPDDRKLAQEIAARRLSREDETESHYVRAITKTGNMLWVETVGTLIEYQGETAILGNSLDITERKLAEEALRESEERFRSLVEMTSDWIWEVDERGRYTFASSRVEDILGYESKELLGKTPLDIMPPDGAKEMAVKFKNINESGKPFSGMENINLHKNGRHVVLESSGTPIFDENGNLTGYRGIDRDITERKMAEESLRLSEEKYREIFWEAPDIFYTMDIETWTITDANKYGLETLEYGPEMMGKLHVSDIIHPDDSERATTRLKDMVIKKDRMPNFPLRILTRTGKVIHIEQSGVIFWDEDGRAKTFLGLAHDVTSIKRQEIMIRERNRKLAALYDIAKSANESLHLDTVIDLVLETIPSLTESDAICIYSFNEATQTLHYLAHSGFPEDFIQGTDGMKLGEGLHGYVAQTREPLVINDMGDHPLISRRNFTEKLEYKSTIIVPLMARGKLLGTLTVGRKPGYPFNTDDFELLTAFANQVAVAMENANLYSQLLQREAHLQSILETSRDGIAVFVDEHPIYRNSAASAIFGYSDFENVNAANTADFFAPDNSSVLEDIRRRLDADQQIPEIIKFRGKKKDGTVFDGEAQVGFFFENDQRYTVAVVRDVTERNRMEFQLQQANKLAAIGELAAGVAHEINNPLATIEIQTGLIRDVIDDELRKTDKPISGRLEGHLSTIETQIQRCQSVTNNLLSFSRIPEIIEEDVEINSLLKRTTQFIINLTNKEPNIEMMLDEHLPTFYGDPNRLEQVFVNILNNALKAIEDNGSITIVTHLDDNGNIKIRFTDSGPGIPDGIKPHIFDPFFTTSPEGEGTGLGLSISHYIVNEMNGRIDVESPPGQGATFTVTLPGNKKPGNNPGEQS